MQILNLIAVVLALLFLVPGYIITSVISSMTIRRRDDTQLMALRFLTFSAVNAAVCAPLLVCLKNDYYSHHIYNWIVWLTIMVVLFIVPILIGVFISIIENEDHFRILFTKLDLRLLHPSPSAWDTKFQALTKTGSSAIVIVTLKDGRKIYGYYGNVSIASSDNDERDLYLQLLYDVDDVLKTITPVPNSMGILITGSEIGTIEFIKEIKIERTESC